MCGSLTGDIRVFTIVNIEKGEIMGSEVISIRLNPEEANLIERLAGFYGTSPAKAVKKAAIEKAENEIDYMVGVAALEEHIQHPSNYSIDDFKREFLS